MSAHAGLRRALLAWYDAHARDLPWRRTRDPYAIWIAEVMLQQTRVETVIPYFERFLARWPDAGALAAAPLDDVLAAWSGLGYYRRARLLHRGAQHVAEAHGGALPAEAEALRAIPGVGAYTTGAIASQAFDLPAALVDGNVARVLARVFAIEDDPKKGKGLARAWRLAEELVAGERPGAWNNALMELGATVCVPREPRCGACPIRASCAAKRAGRTHELPVVSEKPARPRVREIAAVLRVRGADESARVLVRRAPHGLFAGMWEPPRVAARDRHAARAELAAKLGVEVRFDDGPARKVEHVLTHRHLEIAVHQGVVDRAPSGIDADGEWDAVEVVRPGELDRRGVSTLARKLLAASASRRRARG